MKLPNPDAFLIARADAYAGRVEARGVTLPNLVKNHLIAEGAMVVAIPPVVFATSGLVMGALFTIAGIVNASLLYKRFKDAEADAHKDWTEALAKKYVHRAWIARSIVWPRALHMALTASMLCTVILQGFNGTLQALELLMAAWFVTSAARYYVDCAIPKPPQRKTKFKPAFGQV